MLLPDRLELLHAELLGRLHHGVRAGVLDPLGELSGQEEVILVQRSAGVLKYSYRILFTQIGILYTCTHLRGRWIFRRQTQC